RWLVDRGRLPPPQAPALPDLTSKAQVATGVTRTSGYRTGRLARLSEIYRHPQMPVFIDHEHLVLKVDAAGIGLDRSETPRRPLRLGLMPPRLDADRQLFEFVDQRQHRRILWRDGQVPTKTCQQTRRILPPRRHALAQIRSRE